MPRRRFAEMAERMEHAYEEMMRDRNGHVETRGADRARRPAWAASPAARPSCSSRRASRCRRRSRRSSAPSIETANRATSASTPSTPRACKVHSEQAATARGMAALRGIGDDDPAGVEDERQAAGPDHRPRAQRVPAAQGSGREPRHAGQGDRRLPDRQHQRPRLGLPAHRRRPALPLPADLHAAQHQPGRHRSAGSRSR